MILHRILVPFWTLVAFILIAALSVSVVEAMNKAELIDAIASNADLSKADAKRAVDSFFDIFVDLAEDWSKGHGGKKDKKRAPAAIEFDDFGIFVFCDDEDNDCDGLITGIPEICNGQDDDCDGIVDGLDNDCDGDGLSDDVDVKMYFIPTGDTSEAMYARYVFGTIRDLTAEMAFAIREGGRTVGAGQVTERQLQPNPLLLDSCLMGMFDMRLDGDGHVTVLKLQSGINDENLLRYLTQCLSLSNGHVTVLKDRTDNVDTESARNFLRTAPENLLVTEHISAQKNTLVYEYSGEQQDLKIIQLADRVKLTMKVMASIRRRGDSVAKVIGDTNFINGTDAFVRKRPGRIKFSDNKEKKEKKGKKQMSDEDIEMERLALTVLQDALREAVMEGDNVCLAGFGSFSISKRAARTGRNPQTGKEIKIAAKTVVKFKAGKALKDAVN